MRELNISVVLPTTLSEEEKHLKEMHEKLKNLRRILHERKSNMVGLDGSKTEKKAAKRTIEEAAVATEELKKKIISGAITVKKINEKNTFKRAKQLEKKVDRLRLSSTGEDGEIIEPMMMSPSSINSTTSTKDSLWTTSGSSKNNWKRRDMENRGPTIYIRGYAMEYDCISHTFEKFGRIVRINIDDHQKSAFVQFSSESEAEAAIKEMDGNVMNATQIHVSFARHQNSQSNGDGINSSGLSRRNKEKRASSSTQGSSFDSSTSEPPPVSVSLSAWTKATSKDTGTIDLELLKRRMVEYDKEDLFN